MRIRAYLKPEDLHQAYERLVSTKGATVMAGGMFLRLQKRMFPLMIDLSDMGLEGIVEKDDRFEIGAMTPLRTIENDMRLPDALRVAMRQIAGISLRNMATVGGSVMGKYPFSDVITPLLALDAKLHFHTHGEMTLVAFMEAERVKQDILTKITIQKPESSAFKTFKTVYVDFSLLNLAVVKKADQMFTVAIGARPGHAKQVMVEGLEEIDAILEAFEFGSNIRASGEYRRAIATAFLEDIREEDRKSVV